MSTTAGPGAPPALAPAIQPALAPNHPNPFNPRTTISFSLSRGQHVVLSLYDLQGRLVRVLSDRVYRRGAHEVQWDGRDGAGRSAPSGTYLLWLRAADGVAARKVMLVR